MKILEWMHHRFRHNSIKPFKDLNIGSSCIRLSAQASLDDQDLYPKPNFGSIDGFISSKKPKQDDETYFSIFDDTRDEDPAAAISDIFHGFLTIGTLGSDASVNEPGTPTFAMPLENVSEGMIKVTENDLKVINYELEKSLTAEDKEGESQESSARNSNVSIITLGGKPNERAGDEDYWKTLVCPLQGYLLRSSIEIPETRTELKKQKAPSAEHFDKAKENDENCAKRCASEEEPETQKKKSAIHFMKKMIKKVNPSSKFPPRPACSDVADVMSSKKELAYPTDSIPQKKKLPKVLRIFRRKIHPENSKAERESINPRKCKAKGTSKEDGSANHNLKHLLVDKRRFLPTSMEGIQSNMDKMNPPQQSSLSCYGLRGKGEHWINIDDDYLVLELYQMKM